jgi:putative ABC transport system permease protein
MPILEAVRLALAQIRVQKLKSFFTLAGVTIGVMFLIAVVSIVEGMSRYVENDFIGRILGANTFTLRRFPWFGNNTTREQWHEWQRRPLFYQKDVRAITAVLPNGTRWAVESQDNLWATSPYARPRQVEAHAVEGDYFTIKKYDLSNGRAFTPQEVELGAPVIVIGDEVAKFFYPGLTALGHELRIGGIPYQIIGVIEHQGSLFGMSLDKMVIAPFSSPMHRLTNPRGDIDGLMVQSVSEVLMNESMEQVREFLRGFRHLRPVEPDNFAMETSATALIQFEKTRSVMTTVGTALPMIGLIVGGMVIMNIMLVAVAERTREIGIRKSLGARRRDILAQFLVESATLSSVGALIGVGLGFVLAYVIAKVSPLPAAVAPWSIALAVAIGAGVGIIAGAYPASRASRLDPILAMRSE